MTSHNNYEMYADPITFDLESGEIDLENSILLEQATAASGPVLELGCGTGRVTIPLAQRGISVTGLDLLPHMLEHAKSKGADLPIQWLQGDVRTFQLDRRYSLIFSRGVVFQHMLQRCDQEAMLSRVKEHLAPGGRFLFDVGYKIPAKMINTQEENWYTYLDARGREVQVSGLDQYDHVEQIWHQTMYRVWPGMAESVEIRPEHLALRYIMPQEMLALLAHNGFTLLTRYGDWSGQPLTEESSLQIYLCTR